MSLVQITHPRVPSLEHILLKERLFSTVNLNIWSFMFYFFGFRCWNKELLQKNGLWTGGAVYGEKPLLKQRGIPGEYRLTCRTLTLRGSLHPTYYWTGHEDYRVCVFVWSAQSRPHYSVTCQPKRVFCSSLMKTMMQVSVLVRKVHHSPLALVYLPVHLLLWDNTHYFWFLLTTLDIMEEKKNCRGFELSHYKSAYFSCGFGRGK